MRSRGGGPTVEIAVIAVIVVTAAAARSGVVAAVVMSTATAEAAKGVVAEGNGAVVASGCLGARSR